MIRQGRAQVLSGHSPPPSTSGTGSGSSGFRWSERAVRRFPRMSLQARRRKGGYLRDEFTARIARTIAPARMTADSSFTRS